MRRLKKLKILCIGQVILRAEIAGSEQVQSAQVITIATPIILKETLTKFVFCRKNLDKIAAVQGIGGIFLGPIDLAVDMGHGINIFHPEVEAAMDDMIKRIHAKNIPVGTIAVTPEQAKHFAELGASFLALGGDTAFLVQAADNTFDTFKKAIES